jgi:hypothetical protein
LYDFSQSKATVIMHESYIRIRTASLLSLHQSSLCCMAVAQAGVPQSCAKESPGTLPSGFRRQAEILNLNHELRPPTPSSSAPTPAPNPIRSLRSRASPSQTNLPAIGPVRARHQPPAPKPSHVHLRRCQCTPASFFRALRNHRHARNHEDELQR